MDSLKGGDKIKGIFGEKKEKISGRWVGISSQNAKRGNIIRHELLCAYDKEPEDHSLHQIKALERVTENKGKHLSKERH
jgi:hypothetical protein